MKAKRNIIFVAVLDLILIIVSFFTAIFLSQPFEVFLEKKYMLFLLMILLLVFLLYAFGKKFYRISRYQKTITLVKNRFETTVILSLISVAFVFFGKELLYTRFFLVVLAGSLLISNVISILVYRYFFPEQTQRDEFIDYD